MSAMPLDLLTLSITLTSAAVFSGKPGRRHCPRCRRPEVVCYCSLIRPVDNRWPVHILQHPRESGHAVGTARIAALSLTRCGLDILQQSFSPSPGDVLVYPGADARPLEELTGESPHRLLFLDASWRKSRRMLHEQPALAALPRYCLTDAPPSRYRIRREPERGFLSTVEAVVLALETLEREPGRYHSLLQVMDWMIDQQIHHMGDSVYRRHYGNGSEGES
ncbi:MAG: tRNA-uridine aminocarboxypropyltransferase [Pseudohongiellaceae bacterium]